MRNELQNISPLDGRYASKVSGLEEFFSEYALMKYRIKTEVEWFIYLSNEMRIEEMKVLTTDEQAQLREIYEKFDLAGAQRVKEIETITNHDVKAVEYYIKEKFAGTAYEAYGEFVHFACTSEDINNLAYSMQIKDCMNKIFIPALEEILEKLMEMGKQYKSDAMMSRTHGQPATPTTMGKEIINFATRITKQVEGLKCIAVLGKFNGAVGNYNAHAVVYPEKDWVAAGKKFVEGLGLEANLYTTQIEPHDYNAEMFNAVSRINTILIDLNRDIWGYISIGYYRQKVKEGEVGSSTMPHKVNPIDFENSEGNLGLANALLNYMAEKLPISRWQRDLTDSTTLRNMGSSLGYSLIAYKNCIQGLGKLEINKEALNKDLEEAWELLTEPIQVVLRKYKVKNAYERLKELSRGKKLSKNIVQDFIKTLEIPDEEKERLHELTPARYVGLAIKLVEKFEYKKQ